MEGYNNDMYLEMLQQRYGAGLEKSSATLVGNVLRRLGKGMANPKLHNRITTGLQNSGLSALYKGYGLLSGAKSKLGRTAGYMLQNLGRGLVNPMLHKRIATGLHNSGAAVHRVGNKLLYNPAAKLGFNVGGAAGLGAGALGGMAIPKLYQSSTDTESATVDTKPNML